MFCPLTENVSRHSLGCSRGSQVLPRKKAKAESKLFSSFGHARSQKETVTRSMGQRRKEGKWLLDHVMTNGFRLWGEQKLFLIIRCSQKRLSLFAKKLIKIIVRFLPLRAEMCN